MDIKGARRAAPERRNQFVRVLVSVASRHGATAEIGWRIAAALGQTGQTVVTVAPEAIVSVDSYDAVVLGSGIYAGRWLTAAKDFVQRNQAALSTKRVWLFSSGPVGDPPKPTDEPADLAEIREAIGAVEHRSFASRLDRDTLGFGEKMIVAAVRAPDGDFRPWDEIDAWAAGIAKALMPEAVAV